MSTPKRERVQLDMSDAVRRQAKVVAAERGTTLVNLVLLGLAKVGDKKLTALIQKELAEKSAPGRPTQN